jgi:3-oxoacyl-[acyl-carrier protein] reductase
MEDLKSKTALITGASTGIGAAVAKAYAARSVRVAVHYNRSAGAAKAVVDAIAAAGGEAFALQGDVRDGEAIRRVVREANARWGGIDILVNNAGSLVKRVPIAEFDDALFDEVLHINARSVLAFCREVVTLMRARGQGGAIINVSSIAARNGGGPGAYLYAGAKGFVSTATRGLAKELAADNIRVNAVAPGVIQTPFHDQFSTPQMLESFKAAIPMARIGDPDDCVGAFLYLASAQLSGYVTGQILEVNGGQYMP